MSDSLKLTIPIVNDLLEELTSDGLIETLGASGFMNYRYCCTQAGRNRAADLMQLCGYLGPAPVPLDQYVAMLEKQDRNRDQITVDDVRSAISDLVLEDEAAEIAGMAASSGRSLFLFGPAGNGKTSLAKRLHTTLKDRIWIPYCVTAFNHILQLFDPKWHHTVKTGIDESACHDRRWVQIERPLIVGGGEMTMESVELSFNPKLRYFEAPLHIKANGGTFLVDDFGRSQVEPTKLLNRWIVPLEEGIDYLELTNGQKISVPFGMMLIVATNLEPDSIVDPAFLRRMGYRLRLNSPSWERFQRIFLQYAERKGLTPQDGVIEKLQMQFASENRDLLCCHARDLIERVQDVCRYTSKPVELSWKNLETAWRGYFGNWPQGN
jgi:predicted ATPase with chaperone activity